MFSNNNNVSVTVASTSQSFPTSIAEKLNDTNYLYWRQYIELVIKSHKLPEFVINPTFPSRFLSENDQTLTISRQYQSWIWNLRALESNVLGLTYSCKV